MKNIPGNWARIVAWGLIFFGVMASEKLAQASNWAIAGALILVAGAISSRRDSDSK